MVSPESSVFMLSLPFPTGFLPDARLFDDPPLVISTSGYLYFDYRLQLEANDRGQGAIQSIRLVPEPTGLALAITGLLLLWLRRRSRLPMSSMSPCFATDSVRTSSASVTDFPDTLPHPLRSEKRLTMALQRTAPAVTVAAILRSGVSRSSHLFS